MIDIRELRIGNYVTDVHGNIIVVSSIQITGVGKWQVFSSMITDADGYLENLRGIALNEELLLTCGFEIHNMTDFEHGYVSTFYKEEFGYMKSNYALCVNNTDMHSVWDNITEIGRPMKHLHQLQNLYFDLTGEELDINL